MSRWPGLVFVGGLTCACAPQVSFVATGAGHVARHVGVPIAVLHATSDLPVVDEIGYLEVTQSVQPGTNGTDERAMIQLLRDEASRHGCDAIVLPVAHLRPEHAWQLLGATCVVMRD